MLNPLWIRHCEVGGLSRLMVICFLKECRNLTQFQYLASQSKFHIYTFQHLRTIDGQLQKIQEINARHLVMSVKMIFFLDFIQREDLHVSKNEDLHVCQIEDWNA